MNESLRFHPLVPNDLAAAIAWYESISPSLAGRFRDAAAGTFQRVASRPLTCGVAFDDVRVAGLAQFPYLVQFRLDGNVPFVLGVFHTASDPAKWKRRTLD